MSTEEKCPRCGATSPVVQDGICGACPAEPRKVGKSPNLGAPYGSEQKRDEIVADWNAMVAAVAQFSDKYELPKGELIFPPVVLDNLRDACRERLLDTFIFMGVRIRFGRFQQMDVFRQY
jgi:hypothetical protein